MKVLVKICICDDEKVFLDLIYRDVRKVLVELDDSFTVELYQTGKDFLEAYTKNPEVDIVFMDIILGVENGYQIASKIRASNEKIKIIFLTAVSKYAFKGYEIGASRYLMKPVSFSKLREVLIKMIDEIKQSNNEYIIEKNDNGIYKIFMDDIVYIETLKRNTMIHTINQDILSYKTMKSHLLRLNTMFIRCHSGIIVNLEYVTEMRKDSIKLQPGNIVPLSKYRKNEVKEALMSYFKMRIES